MPDYDPYPDEETTVYEYLGSGMKLPRADGRAAPTVEYGETVALPDRIARHHPDLLVEPGGGDDGDDEEDDDGEEDLTETLTVAAVEEADYEGLQSAASAFDDVKGNWSEDRLRTELIDRLEG